MQKIYQTNTSHGKTHCNAAFCWDSQGIPVGIIIGAMDTAFGKILLEITGIRELYPLYLIPALPLAGILIAFCYQKFGGTSSKGMALIFEVGHGDEKRFL